MQLQRFSLHLTKNTMCLHQTHQSADNLFRNQVQGMGTITDHSCLQQTTALVVTAKQHWNTAHAIRYAATCHTTFWLLSSTVFMRLSSRKKHTHTCTLSLSLQFNKGKAHTHQLAHTSHALRQIQLYSLCIGNVNKAKVITLSKRNPYK